MALIHRWTFNGHPRDDVGSTEVTLLSGAKINLQYSSVYGPYALDMNNSSGDGAYTDSITLTDEFTISFWLIKSSYDSYRYLIGNSVDGASQDGWAIYLDSTNNKIRLETGNGSSVATAQSTSTSGLLSTVEANHIVVTCDRSTGDNVKIYVNGSDISDTSDDDCITDFELTGAIYMGINPSLGSQLYGLFDDVQIYDAVLTSTQVAQLYRDAGGYIGESDDTIQPYYRFRFEYHQPPGGGTYYYDSYNYLPGNIFGSGMGTTTGYAIKEGRHSFDNDGSANSGFQTDRQIHLRQGKFSVGIWWRVYGGSAHIAMLGNLDSQGDNSGFFIYWDYANTRIEVRTSNGTSTAYAYSDAPTYTSGVTYHIGVSFDRDSGTVLICQDGVDITSTDNDCVTDFKLIGDLRAGTDFDYNSDAYAYYDDIQLYKGYLDEAAWYYVYSNTGHVWLEEFEQGRDLIGHWTLENTWEDEANGLVLLDLADTGAEFVDDTSFNIPFGTFALDLNGSSQSVQFPAMPFSQTNWSISCWAYWDTLSTGSFQALFGSYGFMDETFNGTLYDGGIFIWSYDPGPYLQVRLYYGTSSYYTVRNTSLSATTWYHIVITYDHTAQETLIYLDGTDDTYSDNTGSELIKPTRQMQLGSRWYGITYRFNGKIKDIQFYNYTLDSTDVSYLYNNPGQEISYTSPISGTSSGSSSVTADLIGKRQGTGTSAGSSSVTGDIDYAPNTKYITGTSSGDSVVSADLIGRGSISGTSAGSSSTSADLSATGSISGTIATYSSTSADITGRTELSGTSNGSSSVTASLTGTQTNFSGTASGQSTTAGDLVGYQVGFAGLVNGSSAVSGNLTSSSVSGSTNGASIVTGDIQGKQKNFSGTASGSSLVSATWIATAHITGTSSGSSLVSATWIATAHISGTSSGSSSAAGNLRNGASLIGVIETSSTVTGQLVGYYRDLSGTISGSSTVSGVIAGRSELTVTVNGSSSVTGDLQGRGELSVSVSGLSTVSGDAYLFGRVTGSVVTSSSTSASISGKSAISGSADGSSLVTGKLVGYYRDLSGTINGSSVVTGFCNEMTHVEYISGNVSGSSSVTGDLEAKTHTENISGTILTSSSVTGNIQGTTELSGTINGSSSVAGDLIYHFETAYISGSISGSSTTAGSLKAKSDLSGLIAGNSIVSGAIRGTGSISGTSSGSSSVTGRFSTYSPITGTITTSSSVSADLSVKTHKERITGSAHGSSLVTGSIEYAGNTKPISGTIATASFVSGDLSGQWNDLSGTISTSSTVTASLTRKPNYKPISGTSTGSSTVSADIWYRQRVDISGQPIAGSTTTSAILTGRFPAFGSTAGKSTLTSDIRASGKLYGSTHGSSIVTGDVEPHIAHVHIYGSSTVTGSITGRGSISVSVITNSSVAGNIGYAGNPKQIFASIRAGTAVTGRISAFFHISGTITTGSSVTGTLRGFGSVSVTVFPFSSVSADLRGRGLISGSVHGSSSASGQIQTSSKMAGKSAGSSSVSGHLVSKARISGQIGSNSSISGKSVGRGMLSTTVGGGSQISAYLKATGLLGGTTVSRSILEGILRAKGIEYSHQFYEWIVEDSFTMSILEPNFEGLVRTEEMKLIVPDPDVEMIVTDEAILLSAYEDQIDGIVAEDENKMIV